MDQHHWLTELSKVAWCYRRGRLGRREAIRLLGGLSFWLSGAFVGMPRRASSAAGDPDAPAESARNAVMGRWPLPPNTSVSLSEFDIFPDTRFGPVYYGPDTVSGLPYDGEAHQYRRDYVNPPTWGIRLDAMRGLLANLPDSNVTGFLPDTFEAYTWTIVETNGDFELRREIRLPINPTWILPVELPHEGAYRITCRVSFSDRPDEETTVHYVLRDFLIASIGDSYASGQGNPDMPGDPGLVSSCEATTLTKIWDPPNILDRDPLWLEPRAARSLRSSHARAASSLQQSYQRDDVHATVIDDRITFISLARTGAQLDAGLLNRQEGDEDYMDVGQLEELRRTVAGRPVDALIISIGGNDAGFAGVLEDLVKGDKPTVWTPSFGDDAGARDEAVRKVERRLGVGLDERGDIEVLFYAVGDQLARLSQELPIRDIYITTYPTGLFDTRDADGDIDFDSCGVFSGPDIDITSADNDKIVYLGGLLNDLIRDMARTFGWHLVDVARDAGFEGHGYCADDTYFVGAAESCKKQGNFDGMMHPNAEGHAATAFLLANSLRELTLNKRPITLTGLPLEAVLHAMMQ